MLETNRLVIQPPSLSNLDYWFWLHSDQTVMEYIDGPRKKKTISSWLQQDIFHYEKHGFCVGSVFDRKTKQFIGRAGMVYLNYDDTQSDIEVGYILHKRYWGKGYATELVTALLRLGFVDLNLNKLVAMTHLSNIKSQRVLEKAGMRSSKLLQYHGSEHTYYEIDKKTWLSRNYHP